MPWQEPTYQEILDHNPLIGKHFHEADWDFCQAANDMTGKHLESLWAKNAVSNAEHLLPAHGLVRDACRGAGFNKAAILIGAGPSSKKHMAALKELCYFNANFPFEKQPFLFIAVNHQFKPCVEQGIIPHFVVLSDASDVVYPQLCKGVPKRARGTVLLAPLRADPGTLQAWSDQGRAINFFIGKNDKVNEAVEPILGIKPVDAARATVIFGGNVLNMAFILGLAYMGCTSFMAVGNDLSYDPNPDEEKRRKAYYGDGDYSTNKGTGRDEARKESMVAWMGFELSESMLMQGHFTVRFKPKATANTLMLYKIWLEIRIGVMQKQAKAFHYFNCSEGGILGVLSRKPRLEMKNVRAAMEDKDNWFMLDELYPKRYHTWTLGAAVTMFMKAWEKQRWLNRETKIVVPSVVSLPGRIDSAGNTGQDSSGKKSFH